MNQSMKTLEYPPQNNRPTGRYWITEGDLVRCEYFENEVGIVIKIHNDVEIPPLVEVLWDNGHVSKASADELKVING